MPIQLTDQQRNELVSKGLNPDDYEAYSPEEYQQAYPQLPSSSVGGTFLRSAANAAPGVAGAMAGAAGWRALAPKILGAGLKTAKLTSPVGIASVVAEPVVAMGAGYLGQKSVEGLFGQPSSWVYDGDMTERIRQARLQQEADMKLHKPTYVAGALASQLPFGAPGLNRDLASGLGKLTGISSKVGSKANPLSQVEQFALARGAVNPAAAAGVGLGLPAIEGQSPDWGELIPSVALAAVQQRGWRGEAEPPRVASREKAFKYKAPPKNTIKPIEDNAPEMTIPLKDGIRQLTPEEPSIDYNAIVEEQNAQAEKLAAIEQQIKAGKTIGDTLNFQEPPIEGGFRSFESAQNRLEHNAAYDEIAKARQSQFNRASRRIIDANTGRVKAGWQHPRNSVGDTRQLDIDTAYEHQTTAPHELSHGQLEDMRRFGSPRDRAYAEEMLKVYSGDEEALVQRAAEEMNKRDVNAGPGNIKSAGESPRWDNFKRTWRMRFGHGTSEDYAIGLSDRLANEPSYNELYRGQGHSAAGVGAGQEPIETSPYDMVEKPYAVGEKTFKWHNDAVEAAGGDELAVRYSDEAINKYKEYAKKREAEGNPINYESLQKYDPVFRLPKKKFSQTETTPTKNTAPKVSTEKSPSAWDDPSKPEFDELTLKRFAEFKRAAEIQRSKSNIGQKYKGPSNTQEQSAKIAAIDAKYQQQLNEHGYEEIRNRQLGTMTKAPRGSGEEPTFDTTNSESPGILREVDTDVQRAGEQPLVTAQKQRDLKITIANEKNEYLKKILQRKYDENAAWLDNKLRQLKIERDMEISRVKDFVDPSTLANKPPTEPSKKPVIAPFEQEQYRSNKVVQKRLPIPEASEVGGIDVGEPWQWTPANAALSKTPKRNVELVDEPRHGKYKASPLFAEQDAIGANETAVANQQLIKERKLQAKREAQFERDRTKTIEVKNEETGEIEKIQGTGQQLAAHQTFQSKQSKLRKLPTETNEDWARRLFDMRARDLAEPPAKSSEAISTGDVAEALGISNSTLSDYFKKNAWKPGQQELPKVVTKAFKKAGEVLTEQPGKDIISNLTKEEQTFLTETAKRKSGAIKSDYSIDVSPGEIEGFIKEDIATNGLKTNTSLEENIRRVASKFESQIRETLRPAEERSSKYNTVELEHKTDEGQTVNVLDSAENATKPIAGQSERISDSAAPAEWLEHFDEAIETDHDLVKDTGLYDWMKRINEINPEHKVTVGEIGEFLDNVADPKVIEEYGLNNIKGRVKQLMIDAVNLRNLKYESGSGQEPVEDRSPWEPAKVNLSNKSARYKNTTDMAPAQENPLTLGPVERLLGSFTNTLRSNYGRSGEVLANAMDHMLHLSRKYSSSHYNHFQEALSGLHRKERDQLYKVFIAEDRAETSYRDTLPAKLQPVYDAIRSEYKAMGQEAIDAGQPIQTPSGTTRERELKEFSFPNMTRPDVIDTIIGRPDSSAAKALKEDFINHQVKMLQARQNMSEAGAQKTAEERFNNYRDALRNVNSVNDSAIFSGNRLSEGVGLPDSWIDPDISNALKRYTTRFGNDRAHFDAIEKNPMAMKVLGRNKDYYGRDVQHTEESNAIETIGGDDIKFAEQVLQGKMNQASPSIDAISNVVNTLLTPGFTTGVWDVLTTVGKQLGSTSPMNIPKLIGSYVKAVGDTAKYLTTGKAEGYTKNALDTGYAKINRTIFEGLNEAQTRMGDRLNKVSNFIRYWNGRQASELLSHSLSQAGGEVQGLVMQTSALAGDKNAQSFMKKLFPEGWEKADLKEIGSRIGQLTQGRYDVTELPRWVFDSNLAPFAKLSRWNIGQGNNFVKYLLDPIKQNPSSVENWSRLLTAVLGAGLAGTAIEKLKEELNNRKSQLPTYDELGIAQENKYRATLYKLAVTADMAGTFGSFGSLAAMASSKLAGRAAFGGFGFPMVDTAGKFSEETANMVGALLDDPSMENLASVMQHYVPTVASAFVGGSAAISGAYSRINPESRTALDKKIGDEFRDMTNYEMLQKGNVKYGQTPTATDYSKTAIRNFKRDRTINQDDIDSAAQNIANRSKTAEDLMNNLDSATRIPDRSVPSMDNPMEFMRYVRYIRDTQGEENARDLVKGYVQRQGLNEVKKAMLMQSLFKRASLRP